MGRSIDEDDLWVTQRPDPYGAARAANVVDAVSLKEVHHRITPTILDAQAMYRHRGHKPAGRSRGSRDEASVTSAASPSMNEAGVDTPLSVEHIVDTARVE